jgi:hypothetical protein
LVKKKLLGGQSFAGTYGEHFLGRSTGKSLERNGHPRPWQPRTTSLPSYRPLTVRLSTVVYRGVNTNVQLVRAVMSPLTGMAATASVELAEVTGA